MPAPSLLQLATATAIKHVKVINDIGAIPYALIRPMLLKVDNPEKLHSIELQSPHIAEEDKELWIDFIKRDIPQWDRYELPEHTNKWYEVYCDLREDVQRSLDADAERMKMAIDGIKSERARLTPKIISGPRTKPSIRQRHVPFDRKMGGIAPKSKSIFAPQRRNNALAVPTKHLSNRATQVKQAPRGLVEEHRRPDPTPVRRNEKNPRPPVGLNRDAKNSSLAEREARLRAIASGNPLPAQSSPNSRKAPASSESAPPLKKIPLKRYAAASQSSGTDAQAQSPPPSSKTDPVTADSSSPAKAPPRPAVVRKRPDSVFIQPKRRRVA